MSAGARTGPARGFREEFLDCVESVGGLGFGGTFTASSEEESVSEDDDEEGVLAGGWVSLGFFLEADDDDDVTMIDDDALVVFFPRAFFSSLLLILVSDEGALCFLAEAVVVFLDFLFVLLTQSDLLLFGAAGLGVAA